MSRSSSKGPDGEPDPIKQLLELYRKVDKPGFVAQSDVEIVRRILKLANYFEDLELADLVSPHGFLSLNFDKESVAFLDKIPRDAFRKGWDSWAKERATFRQRLDLMADDPEAARKSLSPVIAKTIDHIVAVPRLRWTGTELVTELLYATLDLEARCNYALMLLLDEKREIWKSLKVCALPGCNRYFLSTSERGGRPRLYCNGEHQKTASKLTGAERTERWRAGKKARKPK